MQIIFTSTARAYAAHWDTMWVFSVKLLQWPLHKSQRGSMIIHPPSLFEFPDNRRGNKNLTLLQFSGGEKLPHFDQWCNLLNMCKMYVSLKVVCWLCRWPDLCLDHVDTSRAESFDTVVDVHHAFTLRHVQHDIQHDVAAGAAGPHTAKQRNVS